MFVLSVFIIVVTSFSSVGEIVLNNDILPPLGILLVIVGNDHVVCVGRCVLVAARW